MVVAGKNLTLSKNENECVSRCSDKPRVLQETMDRVRRTPATRRRRAARDTARSRRPCKSKTRPESVACPRNSTAASPSSQTKRCRRRAPSAAGESSRTTSRRRRRARWPPARGRRSSMTTSAETKQRTAVMWMQRQRRQNKRRTMKKRTRVESSRRRRPPRICAKTMRNWSGRRRIQCQTERTWRLTDW